jgi:cyclic beta-1,2-glucan synthetase
MERCGQRKGFTNKATAEGRDARGGTRWIAALVSLWVAASAMAADGLASARSRGVFNIGPSQGTVNTLQDPDLQKPVLKFDFTAPAGALVGVWTKDYPATVNAGAVQRVVVSVKGPTVPPPASVALEIKGVREVQRLPLVLRAGWSRTESAIDWGRIGALKEIVFVVSPAPGQKAAGTLLFDLEFAAGAPASAAVLPADAQALDAAHAPARGFFNIGPADGKATAVPGPDGRGALQFDYAIPPKSLAGVWTKGYSSALSPAAVNAVEAMVRFPAGGAARRLSATVELKGTKAVQRIPLELTDGVSKSLHAVDWKTIGKLKEAVLVVSPAGGKSETGTLLFNLAFVKRAVLPKTGGARRLAEVAERGAFNIGKAQGTISRVRDGELRRDVLRFDFTAAPKAIVGLWSKGYAADLSAAVANAVSVGVKGGRGAPVAAVGLEIKGDKETQRIPLSVGAEWTRTDRAVEWDAIGKVKEVVFVVTPLDPAKKSAGRFYFDLAFEKTPVAPAGAPGLGLLSATEKGVFTIGAAEGRVVIESEAAAKKNVYKFTYAVASGSLAGVWTKGYPADLTAATANAINAAVKTTTPEQRETLSVALELKGDKAVQRVPLETGDGWATTEHAIDWPTIGNLKEAVFAVTPAPGRSSRGDLYFDLSFLQGGTPDLAGAGAPGAFGLLNAGKRGVFNMGASDGRILVAFDDTVKKDLIRFEFTAASGSAVGVWSSEYPPALTPETANGVRVAVHAADAAQAAAVAVAVEIKGLKETQTVEVPLHEGWTTVREGVDWKTIGGLKEAVFVVKPTPGGGSVNGALTLDLEFIQGDFVLKKGPRVGGKIGLVLLTGFLLFLATALVGRWIRGRSPSVPAPDAIPVPGMGRDLLMGSLLTAGLVGTVATFVAGSLPGSEGSFGFLLLGALGALVGEGATRILAQRPGTPGEVFLNFVYTGLVAASSSLQPLWLAPTNGAHIFLNNHLTAAVLFALYHGVNAASLASTGKPLRPVVGALLTGVPTLFGALLALQSAGFVEGLADALTGGGFAGRGLLLQTLGRVLLVFAVNEAVANAIGLAVKGKGLTSARGHLLLFAVSLGVVVAPQIADAGSSAWVASLPPPAAAGVAVAAAMVAQAGLWVEVYLVSGLVLDGIYGYAPARVPLYRHAAVGLQKGLAFSGLFLGILFAVKLGLSVAAVQEFLAGSPLLAGAVLGALVYPFAKAIVESFDGSMSFFRRAVYSYRNGTLYVRGAVAGAALAFGFTGGWAARSTGERLAFGLLAGALASAGISVLRDAVYAATRRGRVGVWKIYLVDGGLGAFIGAALAFYLDAAQVPVLVEKFKLYTSSGLPSQNYTIYALLSKWGRVDLGSFAGGAKLFFNESLAGVLTWAIAAWLFAVNRVFMTAYFQKDKQPIRHFFSRAGLVELGVNTIHVLRWGLWMAPIINTGLRMMGHATWYNQDGAIRTLVAIVKNITLHPTDFQAWSLNLFVALLAYDAVRVLIWIDHMGLRVATLVNLSFLGMDKLDERIARFIGPSAAQRYIPEGVKRFTTWAPLLIPFYIPRGADWDMAWETSQKMQRAAAEAGGLDAFLRGVSPLAWALWGAGALALFTGLIVLGRKRAERRSGVRAHAAELANREYKVVIKENGEFHSEILQKGYDVTRRSYDTLDPAGRALFLVDTEIPLGRPGRYWPLAGNFPRDRFDAPVVERFGDALRLMTSSHGVRATIDVRLPDRDTPAELWTLTLENQSDQPRQLVAVPYVEWVLDRPDSDKGHTQYGRLFPEMEYVRESNAVLAWQKKTKTMGYLAVQTAPRGFCTSRMDFIGRARSLWSPRLLETLKFLDPQDTAGYPTFDPIAGLKIDVELGARESKTLRLILGSAKSREAALAVLQKHLRPETVAPASPARKGHRVPLIGHGEIPPGTPQPYSDYSPDGNTLRVHTPFTPRPYDHALSNAVGHYVMVTNRGLHTTSNGNSQQNPVTPDWPDTVTRELPAEAIYLYDPEEKEWFSPTHHPLNDPAAKNTAAFGVDGTAVFHMTKNSLSTELTVFVPPQEPLGIYRLTVKNKGTRPRRLRVAPYFQIVLAGQAEPRRRPLKVTLDKSLDALYFENPVNAFRWGPAFASLSIPAERIESQRGRFFGTGRGVDRPLLVERGEPDWTQTSDDRPVAGFLGSLEIPAGEERTVVVVLGQIDTREQAAALIRKYKSTEAAQASLEETRRWWTRLVGTVRLETSSVDFDRFQNWLKYQAVAERIWARRGFYQTSGAFGFRDQLQDSVNLTWVDPALARKQILLHASQQFIEGDVVHWFHTLHDGRTAFSNRSHASDNLLWLAWAAAEYVRLTGDETLLDEMTTYLRAENPFLPLPHNKHGWGTIYPRSTRGDTVYRHSLKAIDLVLEKRMGVNGIPLIGTGDWNDGLDEIGSEGRGESVWLGFFLLYILKNTLNIIEKKDGRHRRDYYLKRAQELEAALEKTWRGDRYLRAIHDDGTEIGVKDSGVWEIDALTAAWAVMAGLNPERARTVFQTALTVLERENVVLLGWPALREDTKPYLGRSSHYPEGVRENGMYCHGVQWLVKAARILAEKAEEDGDVAKAKEYRDASYRLWMKIAPLSHVATGEIEVYGGQPNKQSADFLTTFDQGRMIWHGYTGAAGWMLRQAFEGVAGASLVGNQVVMPLDLSELRGPLRLKAISRDLSDSPLRPGRP